MVPGGRSPAAHRFLKLLPVCEEAFEMYDLTDDFESSPSYKNLLLELTGLIQTHIELHGIQ